ncbi:MAG: hypothetical protein AB1746_07020 [Candidatus Zixiibacteriota bacterium]
MTEEKESEIEEEKEEEGPEEEGFDELLKFTLPGFAGALIAGVLFDYFGYQLSAVGQWIVRTLAGEGESIFEGIYSIRKRILKASGSLAEAYGWGKFLGMIFPWIIDWGSRLAGVDVYAVESFYIPFFYAMSDQIGANISGLIYLRRKEDSWGNTGKVYFRHPVMITSLAVILIVPFGLLAVRLLGFSPTSQKYTALETIAANLCWLPVVVGWLAGKRKRES